MLQICIAFTKGSPSLWPPLHHWSLVLTAPVLVPVSSGENRWFKSSFSNSYSFSTFLYATVAFLSITLDTKLGCSNNINTVCESVRLHDSRSLNENITWWYSDMCTILVNLSVKTNTMISTFSLFSNNVIQTNVSVSILSHVSVRACYFIHFLFYFLRSTLSVLRGHSFFSFPPQRPMTSDFEGLSIPDLFGVFIPATTANDLRLRRPFYTRLYPLHLFFLRKSQYFPFWMFSAKQGHYWYHFCNVFGMTRSLTRDWTRDLPRSKPALYH